MVEGPQLTPWSGTRLSREPARKYWKLGHGLNPWVQTVVRRPRIGYRNACLNAGGSGLWAMFNPVCTGGCGTYSPDVAPQCTLICRAMTLAGDTQKCQLDLNMGGLRHRTY